MTLLGDEIEKSMTQFNSTAHQNILFPVNGHSVPQNMSLTSLLSKQQFPEILSTALLESVVRIELGLVVREG